jgi:hypothetical protein
VSIREKVLRLLSGSGQRVPVREGDVVEAAVVRLDQSELIVSGLAAIGIDARAVEEHVMGSRLGHPDARIMVRA